MPSAQATSAARSEGYGPPVTFDHRTYHRTTARALGATRPNWSDTERTRALWVYSETGSFAHASRESGIPPGTIKGWIERDEDGSIASELDQLRLAVRHGGAHKAAAWAIYAMDKLGEALQRGDAHLRKNGEVVYLPVKAKDCAWIASIMIDKHALLTGMAGNGTANHGLTGLADKLVAMVSERLQPQPTTPPPLDPSALG